MLCYLPAYVCNMIPHVIGWERISAVIENLERGSLCGGATVCSFV
jgi:hypothetical protein